MKRRRLLSGAMQAKLAGSVRQGRRATVYKMLSKQHGGSVPCFVCGKHVKEAHATLEHIVPLSKGGTDDMGNLSISHNVCNNRRGAG